MKTKNQKTATLEAETLNMQSSELNDLENLFPIEKNVDIPKGSRNPFWKALQSQIKKMMPKDRISISYIQLEKHDISINSIRSIISQDENTKGRFSIRTVKDTDGRPVTLNIYCIA